MTKRFPQELRAAIRRVVLIIHLFRLCVDLLLKIKVQRLLDSVVNLLPSPLDVGSIAGLIQRIMMLKKIENLN